MMEYQFKGYEEPFVLDKDQAAQLMGDGRLTINGKIAHATKVGDTWWVHYDGHTFQFELVEAGASAGDDEGGLSAPMPGKVLEVMVEVGQAVEAGQTLMILEAMKMEHRIVAASDGTVTAVNFNAGDQVDQGAALLELEESE